MITCCLLALPHAVAVADPLEEQDLEEMMTTLEKIRNAVSSRHSQQNGVALRAYEKHGASPVAANGFYMECLKKLRFTDEGKRAEAWRKYRDANDDTFNTGYHRDAKRLELQYLVLSLKARKAKDRRDMMKPLVQYVDRLLAVDGRGYEHIDGIGESIFVEAYGIEGTINPGDWEPDPTNVQGIYDQAVLPHMRRHRDPRLVTAWRSKIAHMRKFAESSRQGRLRHQREVKRESRGSRNNRVDDRRRAEAEEEVDPYEEFHSETLPEMKWEMCLDLVKHGFRDEALPLMFEVIGAHPEHKDIDAWLDGVEAELRQALAQMKQGKVPPAPTEP